MTTITHTCQTCGATGEAIHYAAPPGWYKVWREGVRSIAPDEGRYCSRECLVAAFTDRQATLDEALKV